MEMNDISRQIEELCNSKAEEFALMGYEHITGKSIWECVSENYNENELPPLHQIVNDILTLKVTTYMNWMMVKVYKSTI
ncbi:hypothetical protein BHF71_05895 [Vulcanibacillus modesticaldus]|uniref:Post-transcriptional regulator n=1 Tax=Vulcanibacillus modesticaldus TaxID=337097 RepID=A0A1D2YX20_9BACI|nr:post-transcriptional regulator [Vulcanibacillus modesticaldus]OEG00218.1 hypothetical protein BHF71_05895 [Vulcanibacillus modesticaldus]